MSDLDRAYVINGHDLCLAFGEKRRFRVRATFSDYGEALGEITDPEGAAGAFLAQNAMPDGTPGQHHAAGCPYCRQMAARGGHRIIDQLAHAAYEAYRQRVPLVPPWPELRAEQREGWELAADAAVSAWDTGHDAEDAPGGGTLTVAELADALKGIWTFTHPTECDPAEGTYTGELAHRDDDAEVILERLGGDRTERDGGNWTCAVCGQPAAAHTVTSPVASLPDESARIVSALRDAIREGRTVVVDSDQAPADPAEYPDLAAIAAIRAALDELPSCALERNVLAYIAMDYGYELTPRKD